MLSISRHLLIAAACLALQGVSALAGEVAIQVSGIQSETGEIGCTLFSSPEGFPLAPKTAAMQWHRAGRRGVTCRFEGLKPGTYAAAVSHDLNGNRRTDTKLFGIPTEDWGVSNNIRPRMRAPKFQEAAFQVADGQAVTLDVKVGR